INTSFRYTNVSFDKGATSIKLNDVSNLKVGMLISGPGIRPPDGKRTPPFPGTLIRRIDPSTNTIFLDTLTTAKESNVTLLIGTGVGLPTSLKNGSVTVTITAVANINARCAGRF